MRRLALIVFLSAAGLLAGCDQLTGALGIENPEKVAAARSAEGNAIGGACRHAGRAIEDCYALNKKADKAAIFAGWRDMNDYMRENKIEAVAPQIASQLASAKPAAEDAAADTDADTPAPKSKDTKAAAHGAKGHDS